MLEKELAVQDKGSCFNQDVFQDEKEERNAYRKNIRLGDDIDFQSDSDSDDGIYRWQLFVICGIRLKLLEASLANIARCHGCGSKISLEKYLDQRQSIGAYLKLY